METSNTKKSITFKVGDFAIFRGTTVVEIETYLSSDEDGRVFGVTVVGTPYGHPAREKDLTPFPKNISENKIKAIYGLLKNRL
jgi:hypothetical protein